ncbi:hypothetical protein [Flavobacterium psychrophilum]|nr:hypothetical protein [Flavobacterium psychrophilum]EKT3956152.1 hypothetical protein [Flavobacterium psychrophilum]EKT4510213.1 hypothetical protein [Flavobacterium psychrophilum]
MYIDKTGLIKNYPNQTGYWLKGSHKWIINSFGNFGYEPRSLNNFYSVIGDSYISNIMNPPNCHQARYLSELNPEFDFYPCSRDGASFIEFMEMTKSINKMNPRGHLLFVHHGDFIESIFEIKNNPLTTQFSIDTQKIRYAELHTSKFKELFYNFKFPYYIYRNFIVKAKNSSVNNREEKNTIIDYPKIKTLILYVKNNYDISKIHLVVSPDSDPKLSKILISNGFNIFQLSVNDYKSWQLEDDCHWSCYGHEEAAKQLSNYIKKINSHKNEKLN